MTHLQEEKIPLTAGDDGEVLLPPAYEPQVKVQPSVSPPRAVPRDPPMDNIYLAIVTMIFCCWPCSLVGLIRAIHAMQAHYKDQQLQAETYNKSSKKWSITSFICGTVSMCLLFFFILSVNAVTYGVIYGLNLVNNTCTKGQC